MLDHVEDLVAVVAFGQPRNDVERQLCVLQKAALCRNGIEFLHIFRNDQRQLAAVDNDFMNLGYAVFLRKGRNRPDKLTDNTDLMHLILRTFRYAS